MKGDPHHRTARVIGAILAALLVLALVPLRPAAASVPVVVLDGTGYGHGVGLSQWGAEYLARTGRNAGEILSTFYPGAALAEATGTVRVAVHRPAGAATTLTFPNGGELRSPLDGEQAPGFPIAVPPGGRVRVFFDGAYRAEPSMTAQATAAATPYQAEPCLLLIICPPTTNPPTTTTTSAPAPEAPSPGTPPAGEAPAPGAPPPGPGPDGQAPPPAPGPVASGAPLWAVPTPGGVTTVDERGRSYRGVVEATGEHGLRLVNHVDVEDYLRGMAEVPGSWPAAAVEAQTIAARTYALRAVQSGGEICDDARCQVYSGTGAESAGQDAAVGATARQVLVFGEALAAAVYSADAGGVSATTAEGFGTPDGVYPYLTTVRYETDNPLPWQRSVALGDLSARLRYPGTLTGVRISQAGPSARALQVVLEGSAGDVALDGRRFARSLGLRSTRFTLHVDNAAAPPPPLPAEEEAAIQAMPDEASTLALRPMSPASELKLDRRQLPSASAPTADIPPALDPRRHPLTLVAVVLLAGAAGALVPTSLATRGLGMGRWRRWSSRRPAD